MDTDKGWTLLYPYYTQSAAPSASPSDERAHRLCRCIVLGSQLGCGRFPTIMSYEIGCAGLGTRPRPYQGQSLSVEGGELEQADTLLVWSTAWSGT